MSTRGPKRDLDAEQRILDATCELIRSRGPNRVAINDIAAAANVGKQTIYRWWPSKHAVVVDALARTFEVENAFPDSGSIRADLRTQMRKVAASFSSPTGSIIRELVAAGQGDPEIAESFRQRFFATRRALAATAIERGIARGELRQGLPIEAVVDVLYGPLWLRMMIGHQPLTRAAADQVLDLVWPSIAADPDA